MNNKIEPRGEQNLYIAIRDLTAQIKISNAFRYNFLRGLVFGLGSALGASIIAAVVVTILAKIIHVFNIQVPLNK